MTEKQLLALIIGALKAGLVLAGFEVVDTSASNYVTVRLGAQPSITGRPDGMALLLYIQGDHRYGFVQRTDIPVSAGHTEAQKMETTFQVSALAPQDPTSPDWAVTPTAGDLAKRAAAIMQSSVTIATLQAAGVGIYRVTDVRNVRFQNDRDIQEANRSFDFTVNWNMVDVAELAAITPPIEPGIYPV